MIRNNDLTRMLKKMLRLDGNYILCIINDVQAEDTPFAVY